jgi:hypothetical protein
MNPSINLCSYFQARHLRLELNKSTKSLEDCSSCLPKDSFFEGSISCLFCLIQTVGDFKGISHRNLYLPEHVGPASCLFSFANCKYRSIVIEYWSFLFD